LNVLTFLSLLGGTLISEDLACIAAGLLIQRGDVSPATGVLACSVGIFVGDVGLWAAGRAFGRTALTCRWMARHLDADRFGQLRSWLSDHAGQAIVVSRFLPGTRLPLYVIAGLMGLPAVVFARWALLATVLWTPALVLLTATFGQAFVSWASPAIGSVWISEIAAALTLAVLVRILKSTVTSRA
jgi:membrane protein DedA with SNARE-associated domain